VSSGVRVLRDHTDCVCGVVVTMYRSGQHPRCFIWKLDSGDDVEHPSEIGSGASLAHGEDPQVTMELCDPVIGLRMGFPLWRGTNEN
jgi:hypothetical protein